MTEPFEIDPLEQLRRANPVASDRLPSGSRTRIRARIQEATMVGAEQQNDSWRGRFGRRGAWALAAAGTSIAGAALALIVVTSGTKPPTPPAVGNGGVSSASCVETYSVTALAKRSFAFDGTVSAIAGDEVTFMINERFRGSAGASVTLTAIGMTGTAITSAGGPNLVVGGRYLVAGEDRFAWACGFTQPYDAAVAAQWREAAGR